MISKHKINHYCSTCHDLLGIAINTLINWAWGQIYWSTWFFKLFPVNFATSRPTGFWQVMWLAFPFEVQAMQLNRETSLSQAPRIWDLMSRWQNRLAGIKCFVLLVVLCSAAPSPVPVTRLVMLVKVVAMQLARLFGMTMSSQQRKWDLVHISLVSGSKLVYSAKKKSQ